MLMKINHTQRENVLKKLQKVEKASDILFKWLFSDYIVAVADICHLLTSTSDKRSVKGK